MEDKATALLREIEKERGRSNGWNLDDHVDRLNTEMIETINDLELALKHGQITFPVGLLNMIRAKIDAIQKTKHQ